jgi:hypothetical protein
MGIPPLFVMKKIITGAFTTRREAQHAVDRLVDAGFARPAIRVFTPRDEADSATETSDMMSQSAAKNASSRATVGAMAGGTIGGSLGAIIGGMTVLGTAAPLDVVSTSGASLLEALAGAGVVGALGGLVGAFVGLGMWEAAARKMDRRAHGRFFIAVESSSERAIRAIAIMRGEGSIEVSAC